MGKKDYSRKRNKFILYLLLCVVVGNNIFADSTIDNIKIVVLGSSTAEGVGPRNINNAWVNRYKTYLQDRWENAEVINLAKSGYTTYHLMPDDYTAPNGRPGKDSDRNVTKAIELNPTAVIINLPSNDATNLFSVDDQLSNYDTICARLAQANIPVWVSTTQGRNLGEEGRQNLMDMRDSTFARFGDHAIDFWYGLATEDGYVRDEYNSDNIHMNDEGHRVLFERVLYAGAGLPSFDVDLMSPLGTGPFNNTLDIQWSSKIPADPTREITLFTSRDNGKFWKTIWSNTSSDSTFTWDISDYPDGKFNLLRVVMIGDSGFGRVQTSEPFIIDNPVNSPPDVSIILPKKNKILSDEILITWQAVDVESENLSINLEFTVDGINYQSIVQDIENSGSYIWNTLHLANSDNYQIKIKCSDGENWSADSSGYFSIQNHSTLIQSIQHSKGFGGGQVSARIVNESALTGHQYQINFDDSSFSYLVYNVEDLTDGEIVVSNATQTNGITEGPEFDGIRLLINNYEQTEFDTLNSGWETGNSELNISFTIAEVYTGAQIIKGFAQPGDYKIEIADSIVGYSSNQYGAPSVPMNFSVFNITDQRDVPVIFFDKDNNQTLSKLDQIYFIEPDPAGNNRMTWYMYIDGDDNANVPLPGDVYLFYTVKPFTSEDWFTFTTSGTGIISDNDLIANAFKLEQNYPNPFNPSTKIKYYINQPGFVSINIYNVRGQKLMELENDYTTMGDHTVQLDASGFSSGIYFYQIEFGKLTQTKKMLLIR